MARYKPYKYDQMVMVPLSFQNQLEPGTFEHTLNELVEHHINLSVFEGRYQNDNTGARAIHEHIRQDCLSNTETEQHEQQEKRLLQATQGRGKPSKRSKAM